MNRSNKPPISALRVVAFLAIALISSAAAYWFGDDFRGAEKPSEYVGVVFSILAASLFAVVSIVGDPSMIVSGNSRKAWEHGKALQAELQRFNVLIVWYLITLGFLVISEVVEYSEIKSFYWTTSALVFFATSGFLMSLFVPSEFTRIQRSRMEQEINSRDDRKSSGNR